MKDHKFTLEPYSGMKSRFECPGCHDRRSFTRYIDIKTKEQLDSIVGRCNHKNSCDYHYTPKQFFQDKNLSPKRFFPNSAFNYTQTQMKDSTPSLISPNVLNKTLTGYAKNNFITYLGKIFPMETVNQLISRYFIGTSKHWPGATVFWQIDQSGRIKGGKIMLYNPENGKRVKDPFPHLTWVHSAMKIENYNLQQCLFGEHLLKSNTGDPVALVESEKTAIISNVYFPEFIWLAVGSLSYLNFQKIRVLKGREIYLFPDLKGFKSWKQKINEITSTNKSFAQSTKITVVDILEKNASWKEQEEGLDLADYLTSPDFKTNCIMVPKLDIPLPPGHNLETYYRDGETWTVEINEHGFPASWDK